MRIIGALFDIMLNVSEIVYEQIYYASGYVYSKIYYADKYINKRKY